MLWKYKKCYQETSELEPCGSITLTSVEEVVTPVNCYKLVSAELISTDENLTSAVGFILCNQSNQLGETLTFSNPVSINQCVKADSITVNLSINPITESDITNAINNNNGLLSVLIDDGVNSPSGNIELIFENCTTQSKLGSRSVDFVDGSNNDPLNLPQDPCQLTLIEGIFVFQVNNPVSTTPIVGDVICYINDINDFVNGAGHWYKITISIYTDVTFVKIGTNGVVTQVSNVICT